MVDVVATWDFPVNGMRCSRDFYQFASGEFCWGDRKSQLKWEHWDPWIQDQVRDNPPISGTPVPYVGMRVVLKEAHHGFCAHNSGEVGTIIDLDCYINVRFDYCDGKGDANECEGWSKLKDPWREIQPYYANANVPDFRHHAVETPKLPKGDKVVTIRAPTHTVIPWSVPEGARPYDVLNATKVRQHYIKEAIKQYQRTNRVMPHCKVCDCYELEMESPKVLPFQGTIEILCKDCGERL